MGAQSDSKKVSISSNQDVIPNATPSVSEPSPILYSSVVISLLGAIGLGFVIGYSSPVIDKITTEDEITAKSWMGSTMPLAALFGGLSAPLFINFLGKKYALISFGLPFTAGWACFVLDGFTSYGHELFYVGRALTGLSCGLVCGVAPGYVSEISTVSKRGILGSCFQLFITLGILAASLIGNMVEYRIFAVICSIPSLLMAILMLFMPESPVQIIAQYPLNSDTIDRARGELKRLRSPDSEIEAELEQMVATQKVLNDIPQENFVNSLRTKINQSDFYKPLAYSLALMLVQQMSGVNAILFYSNSIFQNASKGINLLVANAALNGMQSLTTFGEMFVVEKLGRRTLLVVSGIGCSIGLGVMGIYYILDEYKPETAANLSWLPVVTLVFYIVSFSIGLAPIPWLMVPELTPTHNRALISGVATGFNWSIAFFVTKFFQPMITVFKAYGTYFVFMTHTLIGVSLLLIFLPETGGRNLNQITEKYSRGWRNSVFSGKTSRNDSQTSNA